MQVRYFLYFVIVNILLISCSERTNLNLTYSNKFFIEDSLEISLDSITTDYLPFIDYKNDSILTFNDDFDLVTIINTKSHQITHSIIPAHIQNVAFVFWSDFDDNIFILTENLNLFKLNLNNHSVDEVYKYSQIEKNKLTPIFNTGTKPIFIQTDSALLISGTLFGKFTNLKSTKSLTLLRKEKFKYFLSYPLDYLNKNLGGFYFNQIYHSKFNDTVLVSFPGSDFIGIFNLNDFKGSLIKVKPSLMEHSLPSYKEPLLPISFKSSKEKRNKYFLENYSFKNVISNQYKKHFYRILYSPIKNEVRNCSILVYNEKFEFLGISKLPPNTITSNYFVSRDGFYLQYLRNNKRDENNLFFYQLIDSF